MGGQGLARLLAAGLAVAALAGCSRKMSPVQNLPPDTRVFVRGPVDTVSHRVHLYWFGTDPDGQVVAYAFRFVFPPPALQNPPWDTLACAKLGVCTDSLFTVPTGDSAVVTPRFEIFAIDNQGAADPTPAVERFLLSNVAPLVRITNPLAPGDSTYASITASWEVDDPDGGGPGLHYRVWLDGDSANYDSTSALTFTVPSNRFIDHRSGRYESGPRTLYVRAVDDGGRAGPPASNTWYVRAPAAVLEDNRARVLVVDEVPSDGTANFAFDAFYTNALSQLPAGSYSVLRPQFNPRMLRSARDFAQTLRQFKALLWYRGVETSVSPLLRTYQDSLGAYLDAGGRAYIDGLYLVQGLHTPGALGEDFVLGHLGSTRLIYNFNTTVADSTAGWGNQTGSLFRSSVYRDMAAALISTPGIRDSTPGIRGFAVRDTQWVALWAMDGQLTPPNVGFEVPVGVTVPQGKGGRIVLLSLPLLGAGSPTPAGRILKLMLYDPAVGILSGP